jgi:amino acid transporter
MFAWGEDGIFPPAVARIHPRFHTPYVALVASGAIASVGVLGSHFAGDFFLGIDIMVTAMMVNFLLMCLTLLNLPRANPELAARVTAIRSRQLQRWVGGGGALVLIGFLTIHVFEDLSGSASAWYFRSTWVWLVVMGVGSIVFVFRKSVLIRAGGNWTDRFARLPD